MIHVARDKKNDSKNIEEARLLKSESEDFAFELFSYDCFPGF